MREQSATTHRTLPLTLPSTLAGRHVQEDYFTGYCTSVEAAIYLEKEGYSATHPPTAVSLAAQIWTATEQFAIY